MRKTKKYNWSDAWLLLAIIYAGGGESEATFEKIIAVGDWINHAVFNPDEFESGLARLASGKFIKETNEIFSVTPKVKRAFANIPLRARTVEKELNALQEFIGAAPPASGQPQINNLRYEEFSQEQYRVAVEKYLCR